MRWMTSFIGFVLVMGQVTQVHAICRRVVEEGSAPPVIEPKQPVLIIQRRDVEIGCPGVPTPGDAGAGDAGTVATSDAATSDVSVDAANPDATLQDAGPGDASASDAQSLDAQGPDAQVCVPRYGDTITMIVQPRFSVSAKGSRFALLMVTPTAPNITLAPDDTFRKLVAATVPVEQVETTYIEDASLGYQCNDPKWNNSGSAGGCAGGGGGGGWYDPYPPNDVVFTDAGTPETATIQTIGPYQVAILDVSDVAAFVAWLDTNNYQHQQADLDALQPYIEAGWSVIAVRVATETALDDGGLSPLSFTYEGSELRLPVAVSRQPQGGQSLLSIFIQSDGRYDIPGALVTYAQPISGAPGTFLTRNELIVDLSLTAADDPVAQRVTGDPLHRETYIVTREVHIPSSECPYRAKDQSVLCGCEFNSGQTWSGNLLLLGLCFLVLRRRRRVRR